jgi:hypothetical protein
MAPVWRHEMCGAFAVTKVIRNNLDLRRIHVNITWTRNACLSSSLKQVALVSLPFCISYVCHFIFIDSRDVKYGAGVDSCFIHDLLGRMFSLIKKLKLIARAALMFPYITHFLTSSFVNLLFLTRRWMICVPSILPSVLPLVCFVLREGVARLCYPRLFHISYFLRSSVPSYKNVNQRISWRPVLTTQRPVRFCSAQ